MNTTTEPRVLLGLGNMTKDERSCLVYLETCAVDGGGLVEACRLNAADHAAIEAFQAQGLLTFARIPAKLLGKGPKPSWTHYCDLTPSGWALVGQLRQLRAEQKGPYRKRVDAFIAERAP